MARRLFKTTNFNKESVQKIAICNEIIEEYLSAGLRLTLRQLYYQLVSRNWITNTEKSYKSLGSLVSNARLAGAMDWEAIEDRVRQPYRVSEFQNLQELAEVAIESYRLPRWEGQEYYVELWVEKDALAGVLQPLAEEYHVVLMVNRGYSSQSAMYESARRFSRKQRQECHILYLGDMDPSGEDMVRDIRDRLYMFEVDVTVRKIALTMIQVDAYRPPPNPAKVTDPRARKYIEEYGNSSWEVDALPPDVLNRIIRVEMGELIDKEMMDQVIEEEVQDKERLRKVVSELE